MIPRIIDSSRSDLNALQGFVFDDMDNLKENEKKPSPSSGNTPIGDVSVVTDIVPNSHNYVKVKKLNSDGTTEDLIPIKAARINGKKLLYSGNENVEDFDLVDKSALKPYATYDFVASHVIDDDKHVTLADKQRWDTHVQPKVQSHIDNDDIHVTRNDKKLWSSKQDELRDGITIKTINGNKLLGRGNIEIEVGDKIDFDSISDIFVTSDGKLGFTKRDKNGNVGTSTPIKQISINGKNILTQVTDSETHDLELATKEEVDELKSLVKSLIRRIDKLEGKS